MRCTACPRPCAIAGVVERGRASTGARTRRRAAACCARAAGTSSRSASASTSSGLGRDRPVSTKLRCRGDTPDLVRQVHLAAAAARPPLRAPAHRPRSRHRGRRLRMRGRARRLPHRSSPSSRRRSHDASEHLARTKATDMTDITDDHHRPTIEPTGRHPPRRLLRARPRPPRGARPPRCGPPTASWSTRRSTAPATTASPRWPTPCSTHYPGHRFRADDGRRRAPRRTPATAGRSSRPTATPAVDRHGRRRAGPRRPPPQGRRLLRVASRPPGEA